MCKSSKNNLRMDETEAMMIKYKCMIQRLKKDRQREVVIMGILSRQNFREDIDSKRAEVIRRLKKMYAKVKVR